MKILKNNRTTFASILWLISMIACILIEAQIQIHVTGIRPHVDGRTGQMILTVISVWAWFAGRSIQMNQSRSMFGAFAGSLAGSGFVILFASAGLTSPVSAAFLLIINSIIGHKFGKDEDLHYS